jgi:hypothetical protein
MIQNERQYKITRSKLKLVFQFRSEMKSLQGIGLR